jgi:integrase
LAIRVADEYETAARKKRTLAQLQRVLSEMHQLVNGEAVIPKTLRAFVSEWLEQKKPETAPATLTFYTNSARKFISFLAQKADAPLGAIIKRDLIAYRNTLAQGLAPKTVNHHLTLVRMLFKAARREEFIAEDPSEFVDTVRRVPVQSRRTFTLDEITSVLSVSDPEWRSMILFGLYTGQRLGDIASLCWANLDLTVSQVHFVVGKTGQQMVLPLAPALSRHLLSLPAQSASLDTPLHPRAYGIIKAQGRCGTLSNQFSDLLCLAGLRQKKSHQAALNGRSARRQNGELSFHCLRHSTTSLLHAAGIPAAVTQAYVGHASEAVHALYTHVGAENLKAAANALPEL